MQRLFYLFKTNLDLNIALILALTTSFGQNVTFQRTIEGLNTKILLLLFCLMMVVAGFRKLGVLDFLYQKSFILVKDVRSLARLFIFINFFFSMLITNDVALIIFVPLSLKVFVNLDRNDLIIPVVSLETIAANMGSMLTPIGNPQNLFIYTFYKYNLLEFFSITGPIFIVCGLLLIMFSHSIDKQILHIDRSVKTHLPKFRTTAFTMMFLICILAVMRVIDVYTMAVMVICSIAVVDKSLFKSADYKLLLLFVLLFIFVSNMCSYAFVVGVSHDFVKNYEFFVSLCLSQIISNVPTTVMLAEFAMDSDSLLKGVNVGGLGTIVASMASLISFKAYMKIDGALPLYYLKKFTKYNIKFLFFLIPLHLIFPNIF